MEKEDQQVYVSQRTFAEEMKFQREQMKREKEASKRKFAEQRADRMAATEALKVSADAVAQLANQNSQALARAMERFDKQEEAIAQVKGEFKALEIKTNEDCNEAISKANNAVQLSTKLEGDVTAL